MINPTNNEFELENSYENPFIPTLNDILGTKVLHSNTNPTMSVPKKYNMGKVIA